MTKWVERGSLRGQAPSFGACADGPHLMSDAANEQGWGVSGGTPERVKGSALARPNAVWYNVNYTECR